MSATNPERPNLPFFFLDALRNPMPPWLDHLSVDSARRFIQLVTDVVDARWARGSAALNIDKATIVLAGGAVINIANLSRQLRIVPETRWRAIIYEFISSMDEIAGGATVDLSDWNAIRSTLGLRLFENTRSIDLFGTAIGQNLTLGVGARIPIGMAAITAAEVERWGVSEAEVWQAARRNDADNANLGITLCVKDDDLESQRAEPPVIVMVSGDLFATGAINDLSFLEQVAGIDGLSSTEGGSELDDGCSNEFDSNEFDSNEFDSNEFDSNDHASDEYGIHGRGALVTAPSSELLLVLPIRSVEHLASHTIELCNLTAEFLANEPHPLSPSVLWYRGPDDVVAAIDIPWNDHLMKTVAPEPLRSWLSDG